MSMFHSKPHHEIHFPLAEPPWRRVSVLWLYWSRECPRPRSLALISSASWQLGLSMLPFQLAPEDSDSAELECCAHRRLEVLDPVWEGLWSAGSWTSSKGEPGSVGLSVFWMGSRQASSSRLSLARLDTVDQLPELMSYWPFPDPLEPSAKSPRAQRRRASPRQHRVKVTPGSDIHTQHRNCFLVDRGHVVGNGVARVISMPLSALSCLAIQSHRFLLVSGFPESST